MKIAIAQVNIIAGQPDRNREKIIEQISLAYTQNADIVVFGEMTISGTPIYDLPQTENFIDNTMLELSEIAEYTKNIDVLIGTPTIIDGELFNSVVHIQHCEIAAEFNKAMILSRDEQGYISGIESEFFDAETPLENIIEVNGEKLLVAIGDDIDFIDELECFAPRSRNGVSAVVHMEATRYSHGVGYEKTAARQNTAKTIRKPILSANLVGGNADLVFYGGSSVVNAEGDLILQLPAFKEDMAVVDLEYLFEYKPIKNKKLSPKGKSRETFEALTLAVSDYIHKRGFKKVALGLSGGIDSAVVLAVAVNALGAENVEVLMMPSQFSSDHSVSDAVKLAENYDVKYHIIPIEQSYNTLLEAMKPLFGDMPFSVAEENMQSRLRGLMIMALSNKFGHIVLNTSNKCEIAMGYGTLYGDTNGALSILGDLYKGEIYDLARLVNAESEIIPQNIIDKAPSAELRPNQKDSDSLPEYDVLDKVLYMMIEECKSTEEIIAAGFDKECVQKIARSLAANEYKRRQLPPVVRLSAITLGVNRKMNI